MSNFLDVDDSIITRNLLVTGGLGLNQDGDGFSPALQDRPLFTPSDRMEQAQCKFIIPTPGFCIKTMDLSSGRKVFVNICKSNDVHEPSFDYPDDQIANILDRGVEEETDELRMPMSIGDKHEVKDNKGSACIAVDVIINTKFFEQRILVSEMYRTFFVTVALEGIDEKHKLSLEKNSITILTNKKSIGKLNPQFVRAKPTIEELKSPSNSNKVKSSSITPVVTSTATNGNRKKLVEEVATKDSQLECTITQLSGDVAKAEIKIPKLRNPKKLTVTLGADRIIVDSPVGSLDVFVPVDIHQEECRAEFNVDNELLTLHLPLIVKP